MRLDRVIFKKEERITGEDTMMESAERLPFLTLPQDCEKAGKEEAATHM